MLRKPSILIVMISILTLSAASLAAIQDTPPPSEIDGDVYDFELLNVVDGVDAEFADMSRIVLTTPGALHAISPVGGRYPLSGDSYPSTIKAIQSGENITGSETAIFAGEDRVIAIDGAAWNLTFGPERFQIGASDKIHFSMQTGPDTGPVTIAFEFGVLFGGELEAGDAALVFDPIANTLDITLENGSVRLHTPVRTDLLDAGDSPLAIHFDAAGYMDFKEANADSEPNFAPVFTALAVHIDMLHPIAQSPDTAEMVWYVLLDLDGSPYTGLTAEYTDPMYTGLGADYILPLHLQDNGSVSGIGYFPEAPGTETIEVSTALGADRQSLIIYIPLDALRAQAEVAGIPFELDTLHWRVAAINYTDADTRPKDIYPELDAEYPQPPEPTITTTPAPTTTPTPNGNTPDVSDGCRAVTNVNVNLRAGPGTAFERIGGLDAYTEVRVIDSNQAGDWYRVEIEGYKEAWIFGELLNYFRCSDQFTSPAPTPTPLPEATPTPTGEESEENEAGQQQEEGCYAVTNANVNLRAGPGTQFQRLGLLDAYTRIRITGVNPTGEWYRIDMPEDNQEMWVLGSLLNYLHCTEGFNIPGRESGTPEATTAPPVAKDACYAETIVEVNLRAGPGTEYKKVGGLDPGTEIQIVAINPDAGWYKARLPDGTEAWVVEFALDYFWCPNPSTYELPVE